MHKLTKAKFVSISKIFLVTFPLSFDFEMYRRKDIYIYKSSLISGIKYTRIVTNIIERKKKIFWEEISYYYCKNFIFPSEKWSVRLIVPEIKKWFMFTRSGWMLTISINHWSNVKLSSSTINFIKFCVSSRISSLFFFNYARHILRI